MSKIVVYSGGNPEGSSMYLVGAQLVEALKDDTNLVTMGSKVPDLSGADLVVNIVVEDTGKLLSAKRFVGFKKIVVFFAGNAEEVDTASLVALLIQVATGSIDKMLVHSKHTLAKLDSIRISYLSPKIFAVLKKRVVLCLWGISSEFDFKEGRGPLVWVAPFNRVNKTQKNIDLHEKLSEVVALRGGETKFIFNGVTSKGVEIPKVYNVIEQGSREDYLANISNVSMSVCVSNFESFGIYYLELMSSGIPVLYLDKPWVRQLLPNYPFIFPLKELELAVVAAFDNYEYFVEGLRTYLASDEWKIYQWSQVVNRLRSALLEKENEDFV